MKQIYINIYIYIYIYIYDFQQYETIRFLLIISNTGTINIDETKMDQSNLLKNIVEFNNKSRPVTIERKDKKKGTYESAYVFYEGRELILNVSKSGIFPIK